jgi:hypothetical protein
MNVGSFFLGLALILTPAVLLAQETPAAASDSMATEAAQEQKS